MVVTKATDAKGLPASDAPSLNANPLVLKLASLADLSADDRAVLHGLCGHPTTVVAHTDLIREGDAPNGVYLILDGMAARYKIRQNGVRQIMAYLIPGDFCDLDVALLHEMDHAIGTLSTCQVVRIDLPTIRNLVENHPSIARALRIVTLVDEATLREWLMNVGGRSADERVAHLFCELLLRFQAVGLATRDSYSLPIRQVDLADTTGLSAVHVNRTLQALRRQGLIALSGTSLTILDLPRLQDLAEFKANYLHLARRAAA